MQNVSDTETKDVLFFEDLQTKIDEMKEEEFMIEVPIGGEEHAGE